MRFRHTPVDEGEPVILRLRPHWSILARPASALTVSMVATIALHGIDSYAAMLGIALSLAAFVWFGVHYLRWSKTSFIVTTDRVMYCTGILAKHAIRIPMARINGVSFSQSVLDHLVGAGDLSVQAGGVGREGTFRRIPRPSLVQDEIYRQVQAGASKVQRSLPDATGSPIGPSRSNGRTKDGGFRDVGVVVDRGDADGVVKLLGVVEGYARNDLLPDGMAEQIRHCFVETGQMTPGDSVVRDVADALVAISQRLRGDRGASREAS